MGTEATGPDKAVDHRGSAEHAGPDAHATPQTQAKPAQGAEGAEGADGADGAKHADGPKPADHAKPQADDPRALRIIFIGGGNMASALIGGLAGKLTAAANLHVVDPDPAARSRLSRIGLTTAATLDGASDAASGSVAAGRGGADGDAAAASASASADAGAGDAAAAGRAAAGAAQDGAAATAEGRHSDIIVLAVKPQQMRDVAAQLRPHLTTQLVISIAAGIRATDLSRWLGGYGAIVRCMPNTPALVGRGMTGMVALPGVSAEQHADAEAIMRAVGATLWLDDEALLDPVTALSGSGPAYVFYFIEAMQEAGVRLGLSAQQASALTIATFAGAAQLAAVATEPIGVLREKVTSKGGTTHAALSSMQASGVSEAIGRAVEAAAARGAELGQEFGRD